MSRAFVLAILLASGACEASTPEPAKPEPSKPEPSKPEPAEVEQSRTPAVVVEAEGSTPASATPPWFDAGKIEHAAILKQMASQGAIAGGYATAMVLELQPGVTEVQCMAMAREAIGESVAEVPEATSADGRLTLQGKTDAYHYTVVCGDAEGKPTMYMSYTAQ